MIAMPSSPKERIHSGKINDTVERSRSKIQMNHNSYESAQPSRSLEHPKILLNKELQKERALMVLSPYYRRLPPSSIQKQHRKQNGAPYLAIPISGVGAINSSSKRIHARSLDRDRAHENSNNSSPSRYNGLPVIKRPDFYPRMPSVSPYRYQQPEWWG